MFYPNARQKNAYTLLFLLYLKMHTYSNRLEKAGVPPKVKQYLMGHAKMEITQNVYTDAQSHYISRFLPEITGAFDTETDAVTPENGNFAKSTENAQ